MKKDIILVHAPLYQEGMTVPEKMAKTIKSIKVQGLKRGPHNPVMARTIQEADRYHGMYYDRPVVLFHTNKYKIYDIDVVCEDIPPENIMGIFTPKRGERIMEAYARSKAEVCGEVDSYDVHS